MQVHGLAGVELHDVADAVRQRDGVGLAQGIRHERAVEVLGPGDGFGVALGQPGVGTSSGMS